MQRSDVRKGLPTYVRPDRFTDVIEVSDQNRVGGSREHFFHFLLGYLLPLVSEQTQRPEPHFGVLDCGPLMNPHLVETLERLQFSFEVVANHRITNPRFVPTGDRSNWTHDESVQLVIDRVKDAWFSAGDCEKEGPLNSCPQHRRLLLMRSPTHPYYSSQGSAELPGYGIGRRGISNLLEVSQFLTASGVGHDLYEPGQHSLGCQIRAFTRATHAVGIRGAEWANIIWSSSALKALVFDPNPPAKLLQNLLQNRRISYEIVPVKTHHVSIDPGVIATFLTGSPDFGRSAP